MIQPENLSPPSPHLEYPTPASTHSSIDRHPRGVFLNPGGAGFTLRYEWSRPGLRKPAITSLRSPQGQELLANHPSDHFWHHGIWFAVKYINGNNFWEEYEIFFGDQRPLAAPQFHLDPEGAICCQQEILWTSKPTGDVCVETRSLQWVGAPEQLSIDWESRFHFLTDQTWDRKPYDGINGGYSGLAFRASREWHDVSHHLAQETSQKYISEEHKVLGAKSPWSAMCGRLDGGENRRVCLYLFDHPQNARHPTPHYSHHKASQGIAFSSAATLFDEAMHFKKGERMNLRYRMILRMEEFDRTRGEKAWQAFRDESQEPTHHA